MNPDQNMCESTIKPLRVHEFGEGEIAKIEILQEDPIKIVVFKMNTMIGKEDDKSFNWILNWALEGSIIDDETWIIFDISESNLEPYRRRFVGAIMQIILTRSCQKLESRICVMTGGNSIFYGIAAQNGLHRIMPICRTVDESFQKCIELG